MEPTFIHLHNHTEYSILDGCLRVETLVDAAYKNNMPAVAITDHGNIFGAIKFFKAAKAKGVKPVLGCEVYIAPHSRFDKKPGAENDHNHFHLILLVKNEQGYRNLCRLVTKSYLEGFYYRPRIDKELLATYSEGLIGLSSCLKGEINAWIIRGCIDKAEEVAAEYANLFSKGDFYVELQDHGLPEQKQVNPHLIAIARKLELPLVATNDVHFERKEDAESQDVLVCIQTNKKISDPDRLKLSTDQFYFKSGADMKTIFKDVPEAVENTARIAARCEFDFPLKRYFLPQFTPPEGKTLSGYLEEVAWAGFRKRMEQHVRKKVSEEHRHSQEEYEERLDMELKLIKQMGFEGYFLIVWDLLREARQKGIPVGPGRGSAAGSLLAYVLDITDIDPLEYDLLFERFLNPERISLPDIDMDFCGRRRSEMIEYVTNKYGQENVCQIITFGTMAARSALRDVGRVLEVPLPEVDRIAKMIPGQDATITDALKQIPEIRLLKEKNAKVAQLLDIAQRIEGQVRHPSKHAAGIVIAPKPLVEFMPLYQSARGEITTQFDMSDVDALGLLKMDFLGLRNLTVIQDTIELIRKDTGKDVEITNLPLDDPLTFKLFQMGNTDGVFQFESQGMKDLLRRFKPEQFRDLIAINALYRPGPLKSGMMDEFIHRKNNPERISYDLPELEPILRETRGIIVYQEQVMRIATLVAGFSLAEADLLRKAMGKKDPETMKSQKQRFVQGAKKRGISSAAAEQLFEKIKNFAEYGFNKSHSAAYAYLAFLTAYLKAHYPAYFMAALITSEAENGTTAQVVKYLQECDEMGIDVLPPDINKSDYRFLVEGGKIRFGLAAVKNVGQAASEEIVNLRQKIGEFKSPFDVFRDYDPRILNRKALESLIKAGAFDALGWKRSQCYHLLDKLIEFGHEVQKARGSSQSLLFNPADVQIPQIPPEVIGMHEWDESHVLSYELEALGFFITGHPLAQFRDKIGQLISRQIAEVDAERDVDTEVKLAGIVTSLKQLKTKKDERMATFILEDLSGRLEVVAFPEAYKNSSHSLRDGQLVFIKGKVMREEEASRVSLSQIMPLTEAFEKLARRVIIRILMPGLEASVLAELKNILENFEGKCPVLFELETPRSYRITARSAEVQAVTPTEELVRKVRALLGENSIFILY